MYNCVYVFQTCQSRFPKCVLTDLVGARDERWGWIVIQREGRKAQANGFQSTFQLSTGARPQIFDEALHVLYV